MCESFSMSACCLVVAHFMRPGVAPAAEKTTVASHPDRELLDQVFAHNTGDDGDRFLKQYLAQRAWADDDAAAASPLPDQVLMHLAAGVRFVVEVVCIVMTLGTLAGQRAGRRRSLP